MKSIFFLVAMSLMLVGATIAVAIPNPVEAKKPDVQWCHEGTTVCGETKDDCEALISLPPTKC